MSQQESSKIEEIIKNLSEEQKAKILTMNKPKRVGDSRNYEKNCNFIIQECGFAIFEFDEVKKTLQTMKDEKK